MIPHLRLIAYGLVLAVLLAGGIYVRHLHKEAQRVPALVETINAQQKQIVSEREAVKRSLEISRDIGQKLADAESSNTELARRLRQHYARRVPEAPAPAPGTPGDVGDGSLAREIADAVAAIRSLEQDIDGTFTAIARSCRKDGIRQNSGWLPYWESVPPELK